MAAKPKPPTGVQIKNGRYYRVQYIGMAANAKGKPVRKYKWHPLTRVSDGLPALYKSLGELGSKPVPESQIQGITDEQSEQIRIAEELAISGPVKWLKDNWHLLRLSEQEIIDKSSPYEFGAEIDAMSGVYFLIDSGRIVYVGQSLCIGSRLCAHHLSDKRFGRVFAIDLSPPLMDWVEAQYINTLMPELNKAIPKWLLKLPQ